MDKLANHASLKGLTGIAYESDTMMHYTLAIALTALLKLAIYTANKADCRIIWQNSSKPVVQWQIIGTCMFGLCTCILLQQAWQ